MISQPMNASAQYYTSTKDLDTVACFIDFQLIKESPRKIQYLVTDFLIFGHVAQLESL